MNIDTSINILYNVSITLAKYIKDGGFLMNNIFYPVNKFRLIVAIIMLVHLVVFFVSIKYASVINNASSKGVEYILILVYLPCTVLNIVPLFYKKYMDFAPTIILNLIKLAVSLFLLTLVGVIFLIFALALFFTGLPEVLGTSSIFGLFIVAGLIVALFIFETVVAVRENKRKV